MRRQLGSRSSAVDSGLVGTALDDLVDMLDLERLEVNLFRGVSLEEGRTRVFGGQVLAQALVAAGRTVDSEIPVHSLHAYFLRPGDPETPIVFDVDRIRDGRSFMTRRVVAIQHGRAIFNMATSFHVVEDGPEHSDPMPDVPEPEDVPAAPRPEWRRPEQLDRSAAEWRKEQPIEMRFVGTPTWARTEPSAADQDLWLRAVGTLPDDPMLHAAIVAYASDFMLLSTAALPHAPRLGPREVHDREPRPRDVVPPPVPRRRVAAVPLPQPGRGARARACRSEASSVVTASSASPIAQEGLLRPVS